MISALPSVLVLRLGHEPLLFAMNLPLPLDSTGASSSGRHQRVPPPPFFCLGRHQQALLLLHLDGVVATGALLAAVVGPL
jgi:hypothetical protein